MSFEDEDHDSLLWATFARKDKRIAELMKHVADLQAEIRMLKEATSLPITAIQEAAP